MQRRVEIAKGLLNRPQLLLLDEPSTGLDPSARIDLWQTLHAIQATGVTILLTTHLMDEADRCSRLAIMARGKLMACDTPMAMKQGIGGDVITLTSRDPAALSATLRQHLGVETTVVDSTLRLERPEGHKFVPQLIEAAAGLVDSVSVGKPTLEDVFIRVTGKSFAEENAEREMQKAGHT
jgi:ABC-2 type transport system ATP-binding protein